MKQIGQILVERGWVDPAQLSRALAEQPAPAGLERLGRALGAAFRRITGR